MLGATGRNASLAGFDFAALRSALLFVHHLDDACPNTPYYAAKRLEAKFPLITVRGGDAPRSDACEPFSPHGYHGVEAPTVQAIVQWMLGQEFQRQVP